MSHIGVGAREWRGFNFLSGKITHSELPAEVSAKASELREQAERCRRLTSSVLDRRTFDALKAMADEYEAEAQKLGRTG